MFVVDTNILVYAAHNESSDHEVCRNLLQRWRAQATPWYITWGIAYEFLRVTTHRRVFANPLSVQQAWAFLDALFASPGLRVLTETELHRRVVSEVLAAVPTIAGNLVFDARTAILMKENGVKRIYTRDVDFNRFSFIEARDPLKIGGGEQLGRHDEEARDA